MLTNRQLWIKCSSGQSITREDLGLNSINHHDGFITYRDGIGIWDVRILVFCVVLFVLEVICR